MRNSYDRVIAFESIKIVFSQQKNSIDLLTSTLMAEIMQKMQHFYPFFVELF